MSKITEIAHPSYLLGRLQEQIFMLRRYVQSVDWEARDDLNDYCDNLMDTALQLTVSVNEQEKAYKAELSRERMFGEQS